jgi:hypothetical protein
MGTDLQNEERNLAGGVMKEQNMVCTVQFLWLVAASLPLRRPNYCNWLLGFSQTAQFRYISLACRSVKILELKLFWLPFKVVEISWTINGHLLYSVQASCRMVFGPATLNFLVMLGFSLWVRVSGEICQYLFINLDLCFVRPFKAPNLHKPTSRNYSSSLQLTC